MAKSRLDLLLRKRGGRLLRREFESALFGDIGVPASQCRFLDLEESDSVRERSISAFAARDHIASGLIAPYPSFIERQLPLAEGKLVRSLIPSTSVDVYIIFLDSDKVGVFALPTSVLNRHLRALINFQKDGFCIVDSKFKNQLVIQILHSRATANLLDIAAWGDTWVSAINLLDT